MRRRKLMIGLGALTAGGSAAFGTEAFTSVEAERNVDVTVAGDQSAFVAIQPLSSDNAGKYVSTENDNTVQLNFDGDNEGPGKGVSQDAITQVEDLFRIVNQGSQPSSVYFEDSSDAVTFRVTQSTDTSTTGSSGQTLEGADNSVELAVGEQVVVGMTINTLDEDVSGQLLDSVTLYAEAGASAPEQSIPEPQYIVDPTAAGSGDSQPDQDNTHATVASALQAANADTESGAGAVIGIRGDAGDGTLTPSSPIDVGIDDVTITGFEGTPTIDFAGDPGQGGAVRVDADNVTLRNFELKYDSDQSSDQGIYVGRDTSPTGIVINGVSVINTGTITPGVAAIQLNADDSKITNSIAEGGAIAAVPQSSDSQLTVVGNKSKNAPKEGIFSFGDSVDTASFTFKNNLVDSHDDAGEGVRQIKFDTSVPETINGETGTQDQLESLLTENNISSANVNGSFGTKATGSTFSSLQDAVDTASSDGVTLVESATFNEQLSVTGTDGFTLKAAPGADPVVEAADEAITIDDNTSAEINGFSIQGGDADSADAIRLTDGSVTIKNTEIVGFETQVMFDAGSQDPDVITLENNVFRKSRLVGIGQTRPFDDDDDELNISGNTFVDIDQCIDLAPADSIADVLTPDDSDNAEEAITSTIGNNTFKNITGDQYAVRDFKNNNIYKPDGETR